VNESETSGSVSLSDNVINDSVINIYYGSKEENLTEEEKINDFRRRIKNSTKSNNIARELDSIAVELKKQIADLSPDGLNSSCVPYLSLLGLCNSRRGKLNEMKENIEQALKIDPHDEQANLVFGEHYFDLYQRLTSKSDQQDAMNMGIFHYRDVWNNAVNLGAKNNAGYHLCILLVERGDLNEARQIKEEILANISNPEGRKRIESIDI